MWRYQVFLGYGALVLALWYGAIQSKPTTPSTATNLLIDFFPVWVIAVLGVYAALSVLYGVVQCKSYPESATELEKEVAEAKVEMKKRGIIQ